MRQHQFISNITDELRAQMVDDIAEGYTASACTLDYGTQTIDVSTDWNDNVEIHVWLGDQQRQNRYPNICAAIRKAAPRWGKVESELNEDEWNTHGFANAADYYRYRL